MKFVVTWRKNEDSLTLLAIHCVSYVSYFLGICSCLVEEETHSYIRHKCNKVHKEVAIMKMLIIYTVICWIMGINKDTAEYQSNLMGKH
jgi:hypothetical protein